MEVSKHRQRQYEAFNRRYWRGRLPDALIVYLALPPNVFGRTLAITGTGRFIIVIDWDQHRSEQQIESTLLHEMAHIATWGRQHGPVWKREMQRLAKAGAFDERW